jgi:hypothetical protein
LPNKACSIIPNVLKSCFEIVSLYYDLYETRKIKFST